MTLAERKGCDCGPCERGRRLAVARRDLEGDPNASLMAELRDWHNVALNAQQAERALRIALDASRALCAAERERADQAEKDRKQLAEALKQLRIVWDETETKLNQKIRALERVIVALTP